MTHCPGRIAGIRHGTERMANCRSNGDLPIPAYHRTLANTPVVPAFRGTVACEVIGIRRWRCPGTYADRPITNRIHRSTDGAGNPGTMPSGAFIDYRPVDAGGQDKRYARTDGVPGSGTYRGLGRTVIPGN